MKADRDGNMLREVKVEDAVGMILPHDLTQILPGEFKGRLFKKGHRIEAADIPALLSIGKEHIYAMELLPGFLHEDEAAARIAAAVRGDNVTLTEPHEGKITLKSAIHGLVKIDADAVNGMNAMDGIVVSTLRSNLVVQPNQALAGTRIVPLFMAEGPIEQTERIAATAPGPVIEVKPFKPLNVGLITTGSEVFKGRIQDKFGPIVKAKVAAFGSKVTKQVLTPDDSSVISQEICRFMENGVDLILVTGGMSVDPDDRTPGAIRAAGADVVSYGTPMLPGSMLMMAYLDGVPVLGLPGCVMHDPYTSFDVLLPRICAGEVVVREDITSMGYGGLYGC